MMKICNNCKRALPNPKTICPFCGSSNLSPYKLPGVNKGKRQEKNRPTIKWNSTKPLIVFLIIFCLFGIGIYSAYNYSPGNANKNSTNTDSPDEKMSYSKPKMTPQELEKAQELNEKINISSQVHSYIKSRMKDPDSVEFKDQEIVHLENWNNKKMALVLGKVRATNSFGAYLLQNYAVVVNRDQNAIVYFLLDDKVVGATDEGTQFMTYMVKKLNDSPVKN